MRHSPWRHSVAVATNLLLFTQHYILCRCSSSPMFSGAPGHEWALKHCETCHGLARTCRNTEEHVPSSLGSNHLVVSGAQFTKAVEAKQVAQQDAERARFVVLKADQVRS